MKTPLKYEVYDPSKSYEENYDHGPFFDEPIPSRSPIKEKIKFLDFELNSRLGIPAGPLLNARWVKFYADMGFDIPVYKTVRSVSHPSHPAPNCVFIDEMPSPDSDQMPDLTTSNPPQNIEDLSITNSFGVPSKPPEFWMADVTKAQKSLSEGQLLIVSFMGSPNIEGRDLYEDYAYTACMVKETGAKALETNYSCPNLCTGGGSIYADPEASSQISKKIREAIGPNLPFFIKIGNLPYEQLEQVVQANMPYVTGFSGINTIPGKVRTPDGTQALPGEGRLVSGVCGKYITQVSQDFVKKLATIKKSLNADFAICGVGGIMSPGDVKDRITAGADIVMTATAAMWDPYLASRYHDEA